jgi:preprotein translocase subunit SecD
MTNVETTVGFGVSMRIVLIIVGAVFGSLALVVVASFALWSRSELVIARPQPRTELTLKLDNSAAPVIATRDLYPALRDGLREPRIGFATISSSGDAIEVTLSDGVDRAQLLGRLHELSHQSAANAENLTVSDADGAVVRLTPTPAALADATKGADEKTIEVLNHRLDGLQVKAVVRGEGGDTAVVILPRQADTARLKALLVAPGKLSLRLVDTSARVDDAKTGKLPSGTEVLSGADGTPYLVEQRIAMPGDNLTDAQASFDQRINEPVVSFHFNPAGTRQFARVTGENVGKPMAIVLDGIVLAAPVIREPITGGSGQISGGFTRERANDLAVMLRSGALPVPVTVVAERSLER